MTTTNERFELYLVELLAACAAHPLIDGLVLMGSTADRSRVDEWSDHDFAVIAPTPSLELLRGDLGWLPRHQSLVFAAREHHDGFKAVYDDGSVIEFAVTDGVGLSTFHANAWEVTYDSAGDLDGLMKTVAARVKASDRVDPIRDFDVFLASLLIGVGRARRGEVLSAWSLVGGQAVDHLLPVLVAALPIPAGGDAHADNLDARRRIELVHPEFGLAELLETDVETAARNLLTQAEHLLRPRWPDYPETHVDAIRRRLWPNQPVAD
ncbi:MAG TPA: hypothetical protein VIJ76_05955 [Galbitalea sp.]